MDTYIKKSYQLVRQRTNCDIEDGTLEQALVNVGFLLSFAQNEIYLATPNFQSHIYTNTEILNTFVLFLQRDFTRIRLLVKDKDLALSHPLILTLIKAGLEHCVEIKCNESILEMKDFIVADGCAYREESIFNPINNYLRGVTNFYNIDKSESLLHIFNESYSNGGHIKV